MTRHIYLAGGFIALALGSIGVVLPLLPTVPFVILAAFCFARSSPRLEAWLLDHHFFGQHIRNWRHQRAITKRGKRAAIVAFAVSIVIALVFLKMPWNLIPVAAALICGTWIWTRNEPGAQVLDESPETTGDAGNSAKLPSDDPPHLR